MPDENLVGLVHKTMDAVMDIKLKDDDIIYVSDENYHVRVSPYRLTMEIRFPEGIKNNKNDGLQLSI